MTHFFISSQIATEEEISVESVAWACKSLPAGEPALPRSNRADRLESGDSQQSYLEVAVLSLE